MLDFIRNKLYPCVQIIREKLLGTCDNLTKQRAIVLTGVDIGTVRTA